MATVDTQLLTRQNKNTGANRRLAKKRVQCLNEALCFVSSSVLADSLVLRNPLLRQAPKRNVMKKILLLIILLFSFSFAQEDTDQKFFSISFSGGTSISNPANWYFYESSDYAVFNPGIYGNLGFDFGPINILYLSQLFLSASIGYTGISISDHKLRFDNSFANLKIETVPVLFWLRLQTNSKLSPFVEAGIGATYVQFNESYSVAFINDASFNYWSLGLGLGAGIKYSLNDFIDLSLGIQQLISEKEKMVLISRNYDTGIQIRYVTVPIYLRANIKLF